MMSGSKFALLIFCAAVAAGSSFAVDTVTSATKKSVAGGRYRSHYNPNKVYKVWRSSNQIDKQVNAKLRELKIPASQKCSDEVFLRRAYLDVIGTLPHPVEVVAFLKDSRSDKRNLLIESLLDRVEFADYWAMKWCDLLRVKAEFPSNLWPNAVQAYYRWLHTAIKTNMPYDEFARALLTSSGSNFREAPVNFYRAVPQREPMGLCQATALTFMGVRPSGFSDKQWKEMATFFSKVGYKKTAEWKEEIVYYDASKTWDDPATEKAIPSVFPDGSVAKLDPKNDPRVVFSDWLIHPKNEWFARNIVNRVWFWLMGRGIIDAPDDVRPDNPAQNEKLLAYLSKELIQHDYDLRHIYRLILNSETYQRSSLHNAGNVDDTVNFSHYTVRRLEAEVLIDAICFVTETTESYSSDIPEPFTWIPNSQRSIKLADGSITSSFLDLFGRPPRDTGFEDERNNRLNAAQKLHLLNSSHIQQKIQKGMPRFLSEPRVEGKKTKWFKNDQVIDRMYVAILSRYPTKEEREIAIEHVSAQSGRRAKGFIDVAWALINSNEFSYRH